MKIEIIQVMKENDDKETDFCFVRLYEGMKEMKYDVTNEWAEKFWQFFHLKRIYLGYNGRNAFIWKQK